MVKLRCVITMTEHLKILKSIVHSATDIRSLVNLSQLTCVKEFTDSKLNYRRIYINAIDSGMLYSVGWILSNGVEKCMICSTKFGMTVDKRHCHACGNLICNNCSPTNADLRDINLTQPVRVCNLCCWGQVSITSMHSFYAF